MRAAKKAQTGGTKVAGGKKQKSTSHAMTTAGFPFGVAEVSPQSETRLKQQKHKQQQKAPTKKGVTKKGGVLTLEAIQGLNDMFLARALNHLIMGELYELDPMIGDEGCQMRTPFVLDMCRLVQEKMPVNAVELVNEYRARTDGEQNGVFRRLRKLEKDRRDKDEMYATNVSEFISSNPLNESISAKSGEYEAMFADLTAAINDYEPECSDYLTRVCSEGAIYWRNVIDPFGISMLADRRSIFSETILSRRKVQISMHSKKYMARSAARLVEIGGGSVISEERELGYEKKRGMQKNPAISGCPNEQRGYIVHAAACSPDALRCGVSKRRQAGNGAMLGNGAFSVDVHPQTGLSAIGKFTSGCRIKRGERTSVLYQYLSNIIL